MISRGQALAIPIVLTALLAACAPMPALPAPTAAPGIIQPAQTAAASPLPTAVLSATATAPVTPTLEAPAAATVQLAATTVVTPAVTTTPIETSAAAATPTAASERPLEGAPAPQVNTYRDETGGFAIDFPLAWSVVDVAPEIKQQSASYSVTFMSWLGHESGSQGMPVGGSKIDLTVTKGSAASPEAAAESRRQEVTAEGSQITFEEPWDLGGGLAATHWTIQPASGEPIQELVTAIDGNRIVLSGLGDATLFDQIASTLRPLAGVAERSAAGAPEAAPTSEASGAQANQQTVVPTVANEAPAPAQPATTTAYIVRQGDTLAKIAARFGVTVAAILKANPQITNPDKIYIGQRVTIPNGGGTQPPAGTTRVNIYLIGMGGGSVGCGDQVVAVPRDVPKTAAPLTAALNLLLTQKSQYYGQSGLYNALYQSNLKIASITRNGSDWTVRLTGTLRLGGVCDNPRAKAQLEQTAKQFSTVQGVRYFINGQPLDTVLSGK